MIGFTNGTVILTGGNLTDVVSNTVSVSGAKVMNSSTNKLTMAVSASKGTFTGSVTDPASGKPVKFNGVYLQNQNIGLGYSLGTNQSSSGSFGPAD